MGSEMCIRDSKELEQVQGCMKDFLEGQKALSNRICEQDNLHKDSNERVGKVESHLRQVDSKLSIVDAKVSELQREILRQSGSQVDQQRELAKSMHSITEELKSMRINQQTFQARLQRKRSPSPKMLPRKGTPEVLSLIHI